MVYLIKSSTYARSIETKKIGKFSVPNLVPIKYWDEEKKEEELKKEGINENKKFKTRALVQNSEFSFYSQLNDMEKEMYDAFYDALSQSPPVFTATINITLPADVVFGEYYNNDFMYNQIKVFSAFVYENPEFWWVGQIPGIEPTLTEIEEDGKPYIIYTTDFDLNAGIFNVYNPEIMDYLNGHITAVKEEVLAIIKELGLKTTYGMAKFVHDYLVTYVVYKDGTAHCIDVYGALVEHIGVCESYAEAFQYLTRELGINTTIVRSLVHEWNFVQMDDGKWYIVDATHDDPTMPDGSSYPSGYAKNIRYDYFLTGTEHLHPLLHTKYSEEYYHELIGNPYRFPQDFMDALKYPEIEKEDYVPTDADLEEAKIVDEYFDSLPVPTITSEPAPTSTGVIENPTEVEPEPEVTEEPEPVEPEPVEPEPVDPEPVEPEPVDPEPVDPEPVEPEPVDPKPFKPETETDTETETENENENENETETENETENESEKPPKDNNGNKNKNKTKNNNGNKNKDKTKSNNGNKNKDKTKNNNGNKNKDKTKNNNGNKNKTKTKSNNGNKNKNKNQN